MSGKRESKITVVWILPAILLICVTASLAVLFDRMSDFSPAELPNVISLTQSGSNTNVTVINGKAEKPAVGQSSEQNGNPAFIAYDDKTLWQSETNVEIFRLSYVNNEGKLTVISDGEIDKLLAPGAYNEYQFTLENNGDVPLDYNLTMEAWVEGTELSLPVKARVRDYTNKYLLGSETRTADVLQLNSVNENAVLGAGRYASYTLEWLWPFEQDNDELDTLLGNLADDSDLTLNIKIKTLAACDDDPDNPGISHSGMSSPQTGDNMPVIPITASLAAALLTAAGCCFAKRKRNEES